MAARVQGAVLGERWQRGQQALSLSITRVGGWVRRSFGALDGLCVGAARPPACRALPTLACLQAAASSQQPAPCATSTSARLPHIHAHPRTRDPDPCTRTPALAPPLSSHRPACYCFLAGPSTRLKVKALLREARKRAGRPRLAGPRLAGGLARGARGASLGATAGRYLRGRRGVLPLSATCACSAGDAAWRGPQAAGGEKGLAHADRSARDPPGQAAELQAHAAVDQVLCGAVHARALVAAALLGCALGGKGALLCHLSRVRAAAASLH